MIHLLPELKPLLFYSSELGGASVFPPVPQPSLELIYANLCSLAGAKTSRVGSSTVITSSVGVCVFKCVCVSV